MAALLAALVGVAACFFLLPVRQLGLDFLKWVQRLGPWGPVILALAYTPACLLLVPGSVLTLGSGFAFGVVRGSIAASLGSICGSCGGQGRTGLEPDGLAFCGPALHACDHDHNYADSAQSAC